MGGFTKLQHGHLSHTGTWIERLREAAFILHAAVPSPQQILQDIQEGKTKL